MKILHVDDSRIERVAMQTYLGRLQHEVVSAEQGEQALELYQQMSPDLVLLDVIMPGLDGYQVARQIRSLNDDWVPIIFLSARVNANDIVAGIDAGGDDYLAKPVNEAVLAAKVKAMQRIAAMRRRLLQVSQELEAANAELKRLVNIDSLTQVANRRHLNRYLYQQTLECGRIQQPLAVIMADVDHFKAYNDHYGHVGGDECLQTVARIMQAVLEGQGGLLARYGGEEFCVVLPETGLEGAVRLAEELRQSVERAAIPHAGNPPLRRLSLSAGVASEVPYTGFQPINLLNAADAALYQAKHRGRNQIVACPSASP